MQVHAILRSHSTTYNPEAACLSEYNNLLKVQVKHCFRGKTYENTVPSSKMQCIPWIRELYLVLCAQLEK